MSEQRICVVGGGPVGCLLVAALAEHECNVTWVVRSPARRQALTQLELDISGMAHVPQLARIAVVQQPTQVTPPDWMIFAVKAQQVELALTAYPRTTATRVLVVANGLVQGLFHLGLLYGGALLEANRLLTTAGNRLLAGPLPGATGDAAEIAELLQASWLSAVVEPQIEVRQWHKLALNCVANPLTALLNCDNGHLLPLLDSPLVRELLAECDMVAHARLKQKWPYALEDLQGDLRDLLAATRGNSSSMREDLRRGHETEISHMNLGIAAAGLALGFSCPLNEHLGRMVSLISANRGGL